MDNYLTNSKINKIKLIIITVHYIIIKKMIFILLNNLSRNNLKIKTNILMILLKKLLTLRISQDNKQELLTLVVNLIASIHKI